MSAVEPANDALPTVATGTVTRGSLVRFVADGAGAALGLLTGMITARNLGPGGKGTLSSLSYLVALFGPLCAAGLGEAGITLLGQKRASLQQAVSASLGFLAATLPLGVAALFCVSAAQFGFRWEVLRGSVVVTCLALPPAASVFVLAALTESEQRVVFTSFVRITTSVVTTVATAILVLGLSRAVQGGLLGLVAGSTSGALLLAIGLRRRGISLRPTWDVPYLRAALRVGWPIQLSYVLAVMAARVDLLIVNALRGDVPAGYYSVALTLGQLVVYAPFALSVASYPTLAQLDPVEVGPYVVRLVRTGAAATLLAAALIACAVPVITPLAFGQGFRPSVQPALILVGAGIIWSLQWLLCRAWAARGASHLLARSYGASLVVMVAFDYILISRFGTRGAAVASVLGSLAGLSIALLATHSNGVRLTSLVPRLHDFRELVRIRSTLLSRQP